VGNEGVARRVQITDGSIGYMEYEFAQRLGLPIAKLQNKAGEFIAPSPAAP
jgi:phosphate transport system substrate-binding protein